MGNDPNKPQDDDDRQGKPNPNPNQPKPGQQPGQPPR